MLQLRVWRVAGQGFKEFKVAGLRGIGFPVQP